MWATQALTELNRRVVHLDQLCALGFLLFRGDKQGAMDETPLLGLGADEGAPGLLHCWLANRDIQHEPEGLVRLRLRCHV